MRKLLRTIALAVAVSSLLVWLFLGSNRGWTKNSVTRMQKDPVTEIEGPVIEKRFVPGVDFLAVVCLGSTVLVGISFLFPAPKIHN